MINNPFDRAVGKITNIDSDGTITIKTKISDMQSFVKRGYHEVVVEFVDERKVTPQQRKFVWAIIGDIAEWQGQSKSETSEQMKYDFLIGELGEGEDKIFSLSDAPISLVREYQKYLVEFVLENNIPTKVPILNYVDDIVSYVYSCLINKRCAVCGMNAELHHSVERIGIGRDRNEINHLGMKAQPLCREHHAEAHTIGQKTFNEKYHLVDGIEIDKTMAKIYNLNTTKG